MNLAAPPGRLPEADRPTAKSPSSVQVFMNL